MGSFCRGATLFFVVLCQRVIWTTDLAMWDIEQLTMPIESTCTKKGWAALWNGAKWAYILSTALKIYIERFSVTHTCPYLCIIATLRGI
jgi:hypothetical protein